MERKFCRFNRQPETASFSITEIPESGFCLSAFLVVTQKGSPNHVLMGKLNPAADWQRIGALDRSRVVVHGRGWMLPSSHLIFREAPQEAARRISVEQLELLDLELHGPTVVSYVYRPKRFPEMDDHWDIEFIFRGHLTTERLPRPSAWTELAFVDVDQTSRTEMARSHEDILESLGLTFGKE